MIGSLPNGNDKTQENPMTMKLRDSQLAALNAPPTNSAELREELEVLKTRLRDAEQTAAASRLTAADQHALRLRDQLQAKEHELADIERLEAQAAEAHRHQQQLITLDEITADETRVKAEVLRLQRELSTMPGRLQLAQMRHSELLRAKAKIKQELGIS
jgi:hypothetical protein